MRIVCFRCMYLRLALCAVSALWLQGLCHVSAQTFGARWLKIEVTDEGFYQITPQMLSAAGITLTTQDIATLKLYGNGGMELPEDEVFALHNTMNEQPLIVRTRTDGTLESIIFYGSAPNGFLFDRNTRTVRHFLNTYINRNTYMLNIGGSAGRRIEFVPQPTTVTVRPISHTAYTFYEQESRNAFALSIFPGAGRRWVGDRRITGTTFTLNTALPNFVADSAVRYRFCVGHTSNSSGDYVITEAGNPIIIGDMVGLVDRVGSYTEAYISTLQTMAPGSAIRNNQSTLQLTYRNPEAGTDGFIDWIEIAYRRGLVAANNQIEIFSDLNQNGTVEYNVSGFTGEVFIADVTNRGNPLFYQNQGATNGLLFRASISSAEPKRFFASATLRTPTITSSRFANLRQSLAGADMIVITHDDIRTSADAYKAYREQQSGIKVAVVTVDEIYNEFNGGAQDVTAIRDFLAFAYSRWTLRPRYVMMWGNAHYNYRMINEQQKILVPTYQDYLDEVYFNHTRTLSTEDYFVCVAGNDFRPDIAIGRLTIQTNNEGLAMVEKLRRYENSMASDNWRSKMTFVADDSYTSYGRDGTLHTDQSERLAQSLSSNFQVRKIYLADYPYGAGMGRQKPRVTADIVSAVNAGTLILNWIGHGAPQLWAHEDILKQETIQLFTNNDRLFFLTAATCDYQRFDNPNRRSGAEDMVLSQRGGSIGSFGATRVVYADKNAAIGLEFYNQLFASTNNGEPIRLGDALRRTKQTFTEFNDRQFCLLGDPYVQLQVPRHVARALTINNVRTDTIRTVGGMPFAQALSTLTITGGIYRASDTTQIDRSFHGTITLNVLDSDILRAVPEDDGANTTHRFTTLGGILNAGTTRVINGAFTFRTVVPRTTSFSNLQGNCFMYAVDTTSPANGVLRRTAFGDTRAFRVGGVNTSVSNDGKGPDIRAYLDGRLFRSGDAVGTTPLLILDLADDTGLDITGAGIGQSISVWIDNNPVPVILNNDYVASIEDPRNGTVRRRLDPLQPGLHALRVRAFDVFGNAGEATLAFRVNGADEVSGYDMRGVPNPFTEGTMMSFRHTAPLPAQATISIANSLGQIIRTFNTSLGDSNAFIYWDGNDNVGSAVPSGAYYVRVMIPTPRGTIGSFGGLLVRTR